MSAEILEKIPFFDLDRQYQNLKEELKSAVCKVMDSGRYIEGPVVAQLEQELARYLGVRHAITCGNGTDALRIALLSAGVGQGDEVIVTPFSFFATAEAVAQTGAVPVFADISPENFNICAHKIRQKITKKTKAILPVHIFGMPADMAEINEAADAYGIPVIEDACQAVGAEYRGKKAGSLGTMGCFSFYPTKNLGAYGDGGMITTDDDRLAEICRAMKSHAAGAAGRKAYGYLYHKDVEEPETLQTILQTDPPDSALYDPYKYFNYFTGTNSRLDSIQAAVLLVKLKYLDADNEKRRRIAAKYSQKLSKLPLQVPDTKTDGRVSCWHQYAVLCDRKEALMRYLSGYGIGTGSFYPVPLHLQKAFADLGYHKGSLPAAEEICRKSVCLPVFPELREDETDRVIQVIENFFD